MKLLLVFAFALVLVQSCGQTQNTASIYSDHVGDIAFDAKIDDSGFKICTNETNIPQYYRFGKGLQYKGEKIAINKHFSENFKNRIQKNETGFLTIRFVVNCEGRTGRFRIEGMDNNYQKKKFDKELENQILKLTKQLNGWIVGELQGQKIDYYQYLTFKLVDGQLVEIMP
jgi:hypothetical protein